MPARPSAAPGGGTLPAAPGGVREWLRSNFPAGVDLYRRLRYGRREQGPPPWPTGDFEEVFTAIYHQNLWMDERSASGQGSNLAQTEALRAELPGLLARAGVRTMLDAPCGDFHWMKEVELPVERYLGADIVEELVERNRRLYGGEKRAFVKLDVTRDAVPRVDLILCRDCLVHLSFADIRAALRNFKASGSRYLLTTTFTARAENHDEIRIGEWRPLNLQMPPFSFPEPIELLDEQCPHEGGNWRDKSLGLWPLDRLEVDG